METFSPNGAIPWHSRVGSSPQCAEMMQEVKKQTSMLNEVLHVLGDMQSVLQSVASMRVGAERLPASMPRFDIKDTTASVDVIQSSEDCKAEVMHVDCVEEATQKEDGMSDVETEACDSLSELQQVKDLADHQRALDALEAFCASKTATINAKDLVATTKALGFEEAFVNAVGEDLSTESIRYLFGSSEVDIDCVQFDEFDKAMKELSRHGARMSVRDCSVRSEFGSFDAARKLVETGAADRESQASTMDKFSEAHTESHAQTFSMGSETPTLPTQRMWERRPSRFTSQSFEEVEDVVRQLGGYSVTLNTRSQVLGPLECIVIEPMGKQLRHRRFVTTGVAICLHGLPPSYEVLQEWGRVMRFTKWLDMGISVALPNLQMSAALQQEDLQAVVEATLECLQFPRCILVGKFWGASRAVELAARMPRKVDSLILVAPSSPAPSDCGRLHVPVLLCWARDDDTASFEEAEAWIKALDERRGPSMLQDVDTGGHRFDNILSNGDVAASVQRFTAATLMMATLRHDKGSECRRSQRIMSLSRDLPKFLQLHLEEEEEDEDQEQSALSCTDSFWPAADEIRLVDMLPQWIQAGVPTASE